MDDREIIALYWARAEQAIAETDRRYGPYCRAIARRILPSPEDGEECVSDTWLKAWQTMPPQKPACLRAFLGRITRNLALNRLEALRADKRGGGESSLALEELGECVPAGGSVEQAVDERALAAVLDRFLAEQSEDSRRLFVGRYWYMCSVAELARQYDMSESKVKMSLLRTRNRLRQRLIEEGYDG
ncbi:MAG: sigma-70 family RNA polymerase sigma factor [Ruminococcaceae bacterium]|nr:sigma-70 family RNA polymerase sigma factor [Oscillospiraceae bacterium]